MTGFVPLAEVRRGEHLECLHVGWAIAVRADGETLFKVGEPPILYARSALKPLQAIPLVESGALEKFGIPSEELALCCASHAGEDYHAAGVKKLLERIGLGEEHLLCGGEPPIRNNCSGKHAGMLALARQEGWTLDDYFLPEHPVQMKIRAAILESTGISEDALSWGVDGCGVPVWRLPLSALARGFARLEGSGSGKRISEAMGTHPRMVGGTGKFDTALMEAAGGRLIAKGGSEGVHAGLIRGEGIGWAVKILDGNRRAVPPVVLALLEQLGQRFPTLEGLREPCRLNHRGEAIGSIKAIF